MGKQKRKFRYFNKKKHFTFNRYKSRIQKKKKPKDLPALTIFCMQPRKYIKFRSSRRRRRALSTNMVLLRKLNTPKRGSVEKFFPYRHESFGKAYSLKLINVLGSVFFKNLTNSIKLKLLLNLKKSPHFSDQKLLKFSSLTLLRKIRNYRYFRLRKGMPVRGQRTHTNARTRKRRNVK